MAEHWIAVSDEEKELIRLLRKLPDTELKECIDRFRAKVHIREVRQKFFAKLEAAENDHQADCIMEQFFWEKERKREEFRSGKISFEEFYEWLLV